MKVILNGDSEGVDPPTEDPGVDSSVLEGVGVEKQELDLSSVGEAAAPKLDLPCSGLFEPSSDEEDFEDDVDPITFCYESGYDSNLDPSNAEEQEDVPYIGDLDDSQDITGKIEFENLDETFREIDEWFEENQRKRKFKIS